MFRILDLLLNRLDEILYILEDPPFSSSNENKSSITLKLDDIDLNLCVYYLSTILNLMQYSSINVWPALAKLSLFQGT